MSTGEFVPRPAGALPIRSAVAARRWPHAPLALAGALLAISLYAAFAHGAVSSTSEARLQVAVALVAAVAAGAWLWTGGLRLSAPRLAWAGVALLALFVFWTGVSVFWSVAADQTWRELNRVLAYLTVLCLAIALGASEPRAVELVAKGLLLVAVAVTVYALAQKLVPGLHIAGVFDLNQTAAIPRLQQPLGYWNALALLIAMAAPIALARCVDRERARRARLSAVAVLTLMLVVIGFSYSRGGVLALVVAVAIGVAVTGARLRSLLWGALALLAAVPALVFGLTNHALTAANIALGKRELEGAVMAVILAVSLLVLLVAAERVMLLERRVEVGPDRARRIARGLLLGAAAMVLAGVIAVALSSRGLTGTISHEWSSFKTTHEASVYDPHHLLSADSANRWVWWKEAAGAFSDRPLAGWGAGSFGVVHLLYRRDSLSVQQPHSVPLQWLAETGLIGAALGLGAFALLLAVAVRTVRSRPPGTGRLLAGALLTGAIAYTVHAFYDWDWDIPAVTVPALVLLGVLAGAAPRSDTPAIRGRPGGLRAIALAGLTFGLCMVAISAVLPNLAATSAHSAIVAAAGSGDALTRADREAALASSLDPLSAAGPEARSTVAYRRGDLRAARADLLEAAKRTPSDVEVWRGLAVIELAIGNPDAAISAAERTLALDPRGPGALAFARGIVQQANLAKTPPQGDAMASPTGSPGP